MKKQQRKKHVSVWRRPIPPLLSYSIIIGWALFVAALFIYLAKAFEL